MRLRVKRIKTGSGQNIFRKEIECRYHFVIAVKRWFRRPLYLRPLYLRLLPLIMRYDYIHVEFTSDKSHATKYSREEEARRVLDDIKKNPNNYRL